MFYAFKVPTKYLVKFLHLQDMVFCTPDSVNDVLSIDPEIWRKKPVMLGGQNISNKKLVRMAQHVSAKEIIAPYVLNNPRATYEKAYSLFKYLERAELLNQFEIMTVPQGRKLKDILECAHYMTRLPTKTFGLPVKLSPDKKPYLMEQMRFKIIQSLAEKKLLQGRTIHLIELSGFQYLKAYKKAASYFRIRSLSTDYPVITGLFRKTFEQTKRRPFLDVPEDISISEETLDRITENILYMRKYK